MATFTRIGRNSYRFAARLSFSTVFTGDWRPYRTLQGQLKQAEPLERPMKYLQSEFRKIFEA